VEIMSMNSIVDDDKLLTLPNGKRVRLQPHCATVCETFDLQYCSPGPRCGVVWVDPETVGYQPYYERWVRWRCGGFVKVDVLREGEAKMLTELHDKYVMKFTDYMLAGVVDGEVGEKLRRMISITNVNVVKRPWL
jgi:dynein heavy chain, axonemal